MCKLSQYIILYFILWISSCIAAFEMRGLCQNLLTKAARCAFLAYASGAGFARSFTVPPSTERYLLQSLHVPITSAKFKHLRHL